jgi:hypothetical protein
MWKGKYPVNPTSFEKTRLSAGSVLSCQPLSDRTLSPWHHKDNVVISFSSRLCLVCLLAKGNLLSGRPHTHTHTHTHVWVYTLPALPEGSSLCYRNDEALGLTFEITGFSLHCKVYLLKEEAEHSEFETNCCSSCTEISD